MSRQMIILGLKTSSILFKSIYTMFLTLLLISIMIGCTPPSKSTQSSTSSMPVTTTQAQPATTAARANTTAAPTANAGAAKPEGELVVALNNFGNENWLPWVDPFMVNLDDIVYDMLIYYDHMNRKFIPGLAESWEVSPDGLTLTYHLRKEVQFSDGWGELTSADVKYNFEMQASPKSVGKTAQCRRIASMDTPDPYTLVVHFKDRYPTFFVELSLGNSGFCQGILCKKYLETVGEDVASQKPIGTGPYRLVESKTGDYMKFEALDSHWRLVPEFKYLTARLISETSTLVAELKTREIDLTQVPAEQLSDLKAAGVAVEVSPLGGNTLTVGLGGMIVPQDKRYDAMIDNKDPWVDVRVRKAMALAIDRDAICKAILAGYAVPVGVPLPTKGAEKYQYPYDPATARQLLKDAGYPDGFSFRAISNMVPGLPETPRIMEALAGYWQQIGLDPKITVIEYNSYLTKNIAKCKTPGDVFFGAFSPIADLLAKAEMFFLPNAVNTLYQDEGSAAIYQNNPKATIEERDALLDKLDQFYYDNTGPIPILRAGYCFAWNSEKVSPWPHFEGMAPLYLEYVRHNPPLNTYSLFRPWPDR